MIPMNTKKVLIVDDEAYIRILLEQTLEALEDHNIDLLMGINGHQAVDLAHREHPDVIVMDVMMPEMDGFDACEKIKHLSTDYNPHVILLTARGQSADRAHGHTVGADDYVTKPFDPDALLGKVASALSVTVS
jgi:two-component system alkaline phosphatase synthesis response regulator PhoP